MEKSEVEGLGVMEIHWCTYRADAWYHCMHSAAHVGARWCIGCGGDGWVCATVIRVRSME